MTNIDLNFESINYTLPMIFVEGTKNKPFEFGVKDDLREITIKDFYISAFTITQILYEHIMGENPANNKGQLIPVECVSYDDLAMESGFLAKMNSDDIKEAISKQLHNISSLKFRLPSETEWEYAAKGGINWKDDFTYSGSNIIDEVAWYKDNSFDRSYPVGQKKPNQLGLYDMSGNIWEWCEDYYHPDTNKIPKDGSPCLQKSASRILRGGCFHNWAMHCTTTKRYEIGPQFKDPCISLRLVMSF